jgi:hypothetical protein
MLTKLSTYLKDKVPFLFEEKMPVWLTILASIAAALLTYYLAPIYNRQFQIEDTRSAHISKTTSEINSDIIELSKKIRRFNSALVSNNGQEAISLREECLDLVTTLQWRLVDLQVALNEEGDAAIVKNLSDAIDNLKLALDSPNDAQYSMRVKRAMGILTTATQSALNRLYVKSALKD